MKIFEITESKDTHCSDKCCGADVKREDCKCPPTCKHCNCNAVEESATAGGTSAGAVATVTSVPGAKRNIGKGGRYGAPKAPQATKADGTAKNALDIKANVMGGKAIKR
jgi:hypothetical protein|tara:strand:+ start:125 stop:451 length:327 start_codon:yes stop_codon:yes gene_type:complete